MGYVVTSELVRNESKGITFTSLTTLRAIIKYATRPKSAAVKDINDISISPILDSQISTLYRYWQRRHRPTSNTNYYKID